MRGVGSNSSFPLGRYSLYRREQPVDTFVPMLRRATIGSLGYVVTLEYDALLDTTLIPSVSSYSLLADTTYIPTAVSISDRYVTLTFGVPILAEVDLFLTYTNIGSDLTKLGNSTLAEDFVSFPLENRNESQEVLPTFSSLTIVTTGLLMTGIPSEFLLDRAVAVAGDFTMNTTYGSVVASLVRTSGDEITFTLIGEALLGEVITLDYLQGTNLFYNNSWEPIATFNLAAVINNSTHSAGFSLGFSAGFES